MSIEFINADILDWANTYQGPKFHALLCDAPYELAFMGKSWDATGIAFKPDTWAKLAQHLLPGAFLMAFGGSRTYHRMACAIEDAGLIIHPAISWIYGSGFPKATRIDTQIDKAAGAEREVVGTNHHGPHHPGGSSYVMSERGMDGDSPIEQPATPLARAWAGHRYGLQALKPAAEFICVAQKPYEGRPVECITETGAGALNIEASRIPAADHPGIHKSFSNGVNEGWQRPWRNGDKPEYHETPAGRWPANLVLDETAAGMLDERVGERGGGKAGPANAEPSEAESQIYGFAHYPAMHKSGAHYGDNGGPSRFFFTCAADALEEADPFFYCAKASRAERDAGLASFPVQVGKGALQGNEDVSLNKRTDGKPTEGRNVHPTVKPIALNRYLATLLLPPAEYAPRRILIPFGGVGSEAIGAALAGWDEITAVELMAEYVEIGRARAEHWLKEKAQMVMPL